MTFPTKKELGKRLGARPETPLNREQAEKIWDTVGGSMWEIQSILSRLFESPIDDVLETYKTKITGIIDYYIGIDTRKEKMLKLFLQQDTACLRDFVTAGIDAAHVEPLLQDMVTNNILYFDLTRAIYYPQSKSYHRGIKLYFQRFT